LAIVQRQGGAVASDALVAAADALALAAAADALAKSSSLQLNCQVILGFSSVFPHFFLFVFASKVPSSTRLFFLENTGGNWKMEEEGEFVLLRLSTYTRTIRLLFQFYSWNSTK
jgi:hypothetical protein